MYIYTRLMKSQKKNINNVSNKKPPLIWSGFIEIV